MTMSPDVLGLINTPSVSVSQSGGHAVPFLLTVLNPAEAADYLGVPESVVAAEAEAGRLPGRKLGGEWRFLALALMEWLRSGQRPQPEPRPLSSKERMLALAGMWKDDPTVDAMLEAIYRQRKANPVGGK